MGEGARCCAVVVLTTTIQKFHLEPLSITEAAASLNLQPLGKSERERVARVQAPVALTRVFSCVSVQYSSCREEVVNEGL